MTACRKMFLETGELAQQVQALAAKPFDTGSVPGFSR